MTTSDSIVNIFNPKAKRFAKALLRAFPQFSTNLQATDRGQFRTYVTAPKGSKAGVLACSIDGHGDVWVQFAPRDFFYPIDTEKELVQVVGVLLRDEALLVRLRKRGQYSGGTMVSVGTRPAKEADETARILSWSGRHDAVLPASKKTPSKEISASSGSATKLASGPRTARRTRLA